MSNAGESRSREACPACGAHEVALVEFPDIPVVGAQPFNEVIGMGDPSAPMPGLECHACGAEWPSLDAFRAAADATRGG
jgi:hypothetical protein